MIVAVLPKAPAGTSECPHSSRTRYHHTEQSIPNVQECQANIACDEELFGMVGVVDRRRMRNADSPISRLATQPPGPVILLGHSMGGLLAAEAATDPSTNVPGKPKRIIGVVSFDTPFLGMHPHVVITGIASLLPKNGEVNGKDARSVQAMNQHPQVQIVDPKVTDDWEEFKRQAHSK